MEPAPNLGTRVNNKFIHAMGKAGDDKFIIVLNMDKVFSVEEMHEVETSHYTSDGSNNTVAA